MDIVTVWTGRKAAFLQQAMRMTQQDLADKLGHSLRGVAKWHEQPDMPLANSTQQELDTVLDNAPEQVRARFGELVRAADGSKDGDQSVVPRADIAAARERLTGDPDIGAGIEWVDAQAGWAPGTARQKVSSELDELDVQELRNRGTLRSRVNQRQIASALASYYEDKPDGYGTYNVTIGADRQVATSMLTQAQWLDLRQPLDPERDQSTLTSMTTVDGGELDDFGAERAIQRIVETLQTDTRMVDAPLYRMRGVDIGNGRFGGDFGMTSFVRYALTMDLLENEIVDAIAAGKGLDSESLPLRSRYLSDVSAVLDTTTRICAGGPLALCAIARPASRPRRTEPDYVLLVQERGGRVLNAARRRAVIPKCFHEPMTDYRNDVRVGASLQRELEEELFGRDDVDGTLGPQRNADPMHANRLSDPMRWLVEHDNGTDWQMECTGFGFNLVSGNYEFASLVVIHNEEFWERFGGHITANWESDSLQQYSSLDSEILTELACDPAWSNEGVFALLQGLRRLSELGGKQVDAPAIEWEVA